MFVVVVLTVVTSNGALLYADGEALVWRILFGWAMTTQTHSRASARTKLCSRRFGSSKKRNYAHVQNGTAIASGYATCVTGARVRLQLLSFCSRVWCALEAPLCIVSQYCERAMPPVRVVCLKRSLYYQRYGTVGTVGTTVPAPFEPFCAQTPFDTAPSSTRD